MNKFNEIYLHMFFEEAGKILFNLNDFKNFLETSIKYKDGNIINEDKNLLIDVPSEFFNYCYDHQNQIIKFNELKNLMKNSKHFKNIKGIEGKDLYFTIFNFNEKSEIKSFIFKTFNLRENDELFQEAFQYFEENCKNIDGFFNFYDNIGFCVINENSKNIETTIYHELSHYVQQVCNIRIIKDFKFDIEKLENNERFKKLKLLNVSYENLNYYFSNTEFSTHVDDLIIGLWNLFNKFYKNKIKTIYEFLLDLNNEIKKNDDFSKSKILQKYAIANNGDTAPLIMYVASYYFNHKYQKINKILEYQLNQKFNEI